MWDLFVNDECRNILTSDTSKSSRLLKSKRKFFVTQNIKITLTAPEYFTNHDVMSLGIKPQKDG